MSFLNKLIRTISNSANIDVGDIAGKAETMAGYATLSKTGKGLALLNWRWSEDAMTTDKGTGKPLRNWDRQTKLDPRLDDIFLSWEKQSYEAEEYMIFFGWQGWPYAMIERDHPEQYFTPEYVEGLANNSFNSVKYLTVKASDAPVNCIKLPASETDNEFYYVKVVGKSADGSLHDVKGCELGSVFRREKDGLSAVPEGEIPEIKPPNGGRERNELENELAKKAKMKKKK